MTISSKQIKEDQVYTKAEVDALIEYAVEQARQIDQASMAKPVSYTHLTLPTNSGV